MKREDNGLPYQLYKKEIHSNKIYLCNSGIDAKFNVNSVGTVPAALTVFDLANKLGIDLVINPGTAGGFKARGGNIGDIYLASKVLFHHREIPMGPYEPYGLGSLMLMILTNLILHSLLKQGFFLQVTA